MGESNLKIDKQVAGASYNLDCTVLGRPSRYSLTVALNKCADICVGIYICVYIVKNQDWG